MKRQIALDTETTGKSDDGTPGDHRIVEVGCVEIVDRRLTGRSLQLYVNPGRPVDEEAFRVHGLSDEFLAGKPAFSEIAAELRDFIRGSELLIHNAKFDLGFLDKEWLLCGMEERTADLAGVVDTVSLAMKLCPGHQVNLDNLCNIYDVDRSARTVHGALLDAQLLAEVYLAMTGGQRSLDFGESLSDGGARRWTRPRGVVLPRLEVPEELRAVHTVRLIELAQGRVLYEKDGTAMAGSDWDGGFDMPFLKQGEQESKREYKARLRAQREEMAARLLTPDEQSLYADYLKKDRELYRLWEDRVTGRGGKS